MDQTKGPGETKTKSEKEKEMTKEIVDEVMDSVQKSLNDFFASGARGVESLSKKGVTAITKGLKFVLPKIIPAAVEEVMEKHVQQEAKKRKAQKTKE